MASSFNVELVYVILKGITQFSYLNCNDGTCKFSLEKAKKMTLEKKDGNLTITLKQIKIKNFDNWSQMKTGDLRETKNENEFQNRISSHIKEV